MCVCVHGCDTRKHGGVGMRYENLAVDDREVQCGHGGRRTQQAEELRQLRPRGKGKL